MTPDVTLPTSCFQYSGVMETGLFRYITAVQLSPKLISHDF